MTTMKVTKSRPWLSAALAGGLVGLALLVIPVSYEKTTGHEVQISVSGGSLDMETAGEMARQLERALAAEHVAMDVGSTPDGIRYTLRASVPTRKGFQTPAAAQAFASGLGRLGYTASAVTSARKERVSGNVYAYARDRVIQVSLDGKSAAEIEAEIRRRLADTGLTSAKVSVEKIEGDDSKLAFKIKAEHMVKPGDHHSADAAKEIPQLLLTRNGAPVGEEFRVQIQKARSMDGITLVIDVVQKGRTAQAKVPNSDSMTDAALAAAIQTQLERGGLSVTVAVKDEGIDIKPKP